MSQTFHFTIIRNIKKYSEIQTPVWWLPEEKGVGEVEEGKEGIHGDGKRLDLGWWTHNTIYRWCITELYTWNLYSFINQCHPNKINLKREKKRMCHSTRMVCISKWFCNRVQPRGGPQIGICNGVQNSRCPGNIRNIYIGCPHPPQAWAGGRDTWSRAIQSCFVQQQLCS